MDKNSAQKIHKSKALLGFTLIELLIVVSLLGILAGLALTVINPDRQKKIAEDAVRRSNIEKLSQAIESFCTAEGKCPLATEIVFAATATPTLNASVLVYVKQWPVGSLSTVVADIKYSYYADSTTSPQNFEVNVKMMSSTKYLRYNSSWGQIKECANIPASAWDASCT
jgi:prepilin-type N-terminal cleavage/methylation domain-containing protein